jgi:hypothetical protein
MALTIEEKNKMLEMLANPIRGQAQTGVTPQTFGMVKVSTLIQYREKPDEEIRAELELFTVRKRQAIQKQLDLIEANRIKLLAQLEA